MSQMSQTTTGRPATYADLEAVPEHLVAEILFGNLVTHPRPTTSHGAAATSLADELVGPFQKGRGGPGGWLFIGEEQVHLGPHVTVPDIAGWRRERLPPGAGETAFLEVPPDWICEIISPSTEKYDKGDKRRIYALYGVRHLWYVDPRARTLEVFVLHEHNWLLTHTFVDREVVSAPPFGELTFNLDLLWPFDPPAPTNTDPAP
jgi:Uma2 family endonuclease